MLRGTRRQLLIGALAGGSVAALTACSAPRRGKEEAVDGASLDGASVRTASPATGSLRGGTRVVLTGSGLAAVHSVQVGATAVEPVRRGDASVVLMTPPAADYRGGDVDVRLLDAAGEEVAAASWTYAAADGVDRQLEYVLRYWKDYNPAYQPLGDTDCVDFTSQSLLERGWTQQGAWTHAEQVAQSGPAWVSSTAFRDFMLANPALGTPLTDDQRDRVRLGDVVQFDWDRSGDRDHTGVVTRITEVDGRIRIGFAGHTKDSDYRDVDDSITTDHPGGVAHYWSLA